MTTNRLKGNGGEKPPKRSAAEWAQWLNENRADEVNRDRAKEGLAPIHWIVADGRCVVAWKHPAWSMIRYENSRKPLMDRRGQPMSESDTFALNKELESLGAKASYRRDGSRYLINGA